MPSQKPNIIENLRAKHEPHQKLAARVLGLEKRVSKLDGTKALPPGKDTKALPPVAKKTKIGASSFKKGTALDPGYAARVQGKDATGEYISAEERKAQFKKTKITGADIKRTGAVGSAENAAEVDANQKAAIDKAKIDLATKYEGSPADSIKPPDAEAEKGGALAKPTETLIGPLKTIDNGVNNIVETLKKSNKVDADAQADARKQAEKDKRKKAEGKLEGVKGALSKAADTVLKPVKNIFQQIWDFLKIVFFGRIAMKLFEWFTNPENTKKVSAIFRFLKDWWPVLVAGIMAIVGPGIIFTVGLIALLAWGIPKIVNIVKTLFGFGPKVDKELKNVEQDADALGQDSKKEVEAQGLEPKEETEDKPPETDQTSAQVGESEKQAEDLKSGADKSEMPPETVKMAQGGEVPGTGSGDTVPAMLTPGEFVMSKGAVQQYGANTLAGMNAAAGGTNRPTPSGGYNTGGKAFDRSHYGTEGYQIGQIQPDKLVVSRTSFTNKAQEGGASTGADFEKFNEDVDMSMPGRIRDAVKYKEGSLVGEETFEEDIAAIGVPDLLEHKDQLLSEIHAVPGYENITIGDVINSNVDMPLKQYLPILMRSDAQKATFAKQSAAYQRDKQIRGIKEGEGFSMGYGGGGLVPILGFAGGGLVQPQAQIKGNSKTPTIKPPPTIVKNSGGGGGPNKVTQINNKGKEGGKGDVPTIDAAAMRDREKIIVLGITV